jgi:hypothetical protein
MNLGAPELLILALIFLIPVGIGYWCMKVFRGKGKSPALGFVAGFFLTLFLSLLGAVVAMLIAYLQSPASSERTTIGPPAPPPPPAVSAHAQTIATFGHTTGWQGKRIVYDAGSIVIEGVGPVSAPGVLSYEAQGQIEWASPAMRDWLVGLARSS